MNVRLKPIGKQVVVITGASSGIGRETALRFAERGAKVVAAARSKPGLVSLMDDVVARGGEAAWMLCDVADFGQVQALARFAEEQFGRIDTWVNNAGVLLLGRFEETAPEEFRRLMEVNYLGQIHGALAALPYLRRQGGALISVSSAESIVALPLHSAYSASKHALTGAMDGLRRELMAEGAPISVTTVRPATINTPFFTNARNRMDVKPKAPPPLYEPGLVADCILHAAEHPVRDLYAGGTGRLLASGQMLTPGLMDAALARFGIEVSRSDEPRPGGSGGNLHEPSGDARVRGDFEDQTLPVSPLTWMETHPHARALAAGGVLAALLLARRRRRASRRRRR